MSKGKTLWIGGTSSLTRTFLSCQLLDPQRLVVVGLEPSPPDWMPSAVEYVSCDLTTVTDSQAKEIFLGTKVKDVSSIIIGVRPLLFAKYIHTDLPQRMLQGIQKLVKSACEVLDSKLKFVLHVSSVAVMDHLKSQRLVTETDPFPPLSEYNGPYDKFKRHCEGEITRLCQEYSNTATACHLRLSGLFSDDSSCINCTAMELQSYIAGYFPLPVDFNSSVNVSRAIATLLEQANKDHTKIQNVYYYTRPLLMKKPVPYGALVQEYRRAHGLDQVSLWLPFWFVRFLVATLNYLSILNQYLNLPYIDAADYLLQVVIHEHSFDCSKFAKDFPHFQLQEESIFECFVRQKATQEKAWQPKLCQYQQSGKKDTTAFVHSMGYLLDQGWGFLSLFLVGATCASLLMITLN